MAASPHPDLWSAPSAGDLLISGVQSILGSVTHLPIRFWKPNMFFTGAIDSRLHKLTNGRFPATTAPGRSHPVYSLKKLPDDVGAVVCPCTSRRPSGRAIRRYIRKGCRLRPTGHVMDRDSFLVEKLRFVMPRSAACELRFRGEVPEECLQTLKR